MQPLNKKIEKFLCPCGKSINPAELNAHCNGCKPMLDNFRGLIGAFVELKTKANGDD